MYQKFLKTCKWFRKFVCSNFGLSGVERLTIPFPFYSDFDVNFLVYDKTGTVLNGTRTLREAIKERNKRGIETVGISVIYNKY